MNDFKSQLNKKKGTNVVPKVKNDLDEKVKAVAECIEGYIVNSVAPGYGSNERIRAKVCVTQRYNDMVTVKTPKRDTSGRTLENTMEVVLSADAIYFEKKLRSILAEDGFKVGKWTFMKFTDRSTDDYGENFFGEVGWCIYPEAYFSQTGVAINPYMKYMTQYVKPLFGTGRWQMIQGGTYVDFHQAGVLGFVVSYEE